MDCKEYSSLFSILLTNEIPSDLSKNKRDALKRRSKDFRLKDGLLFYIDQKRGIERQVIKADQKDQILEVCI